MGQIGFGLYLISDRKLFPGNDAFSAAVEAALRGGLRALQLREKDLPTVELLALAYRMRALTSKYSAQLFVNERVDVALCSGADGVHLGQAGMPVHAAVKIARGRLLIGASAHSLQEAGAAEREGADFITFGPLYQTPSKVKYGAPVGLVELKRVTAQSCIPVFGIGGIGLDAVNAVMNCGASGIAVISGILGSADAGAAAENYLKEINAKKINHRGTEANP